MNLLSKFREEKQLKSIMNLTFIYVPLKWTWLSPKDFSGLLALVDYIMDMLPMALLVNV